MAIYSSIICFCKVFIGNPCNKKINSFTNIAPFLNLHFEEVKLKRYSPNSVSAKRTLDEKLK